MKKNAGKACTASLMTGLLKKSSYNISNIKMVIFIERCLKLVKMVLGKIMIQ